MQRKGVVIRETELFRIVQYGDQLDIEPLSPRVTELRNAGIAVSVIEADEEHELRPFLPQLRARDASAVVLTEIDRRRAIIVLTEAQYPSRAQ